MGHKTSLIEKSRRNLLVLPVESLVNSDLLANFARSRTKGSLVEKFVDVYVPDN